MSILDTLRGDTKVTILTGEVFTGQEGLVSTGSILEIDCTLEETHARSAELVDSPVEQGFNITDHRRTAPISLSMRGLITDSPSGFFDAIGETFDPGAASRSVDAFGILEGMHNSGELATIVTSLRLYEKMALVSFSVRRDKDTGKALYFDISWREIRIAETQTVAVDVIADPEAPAPAPVEKHGTAAKAPVEANPDSLANQVSKGLLEPTAFVKGLKDTVAKGMGN